MILDEARQVIVDDENETHRVSGIRLYREQPIFVLIQSLEGLD